MSEFLGFIRNELAELESKDADNLFEIIRENCIELGFPMDDGDEETIHAEIENHLK